MTSAVSPAVPTPEEDSKQTELSVSESKPGVPGPAQKTL